MTRACWLAALALLLAAGVSSGGEPPLCSDGTFVVEGDPLLPGSGLEGPDVVRLDDGRLSIASGCPARDASLRAASGGTVGRVRFGGPARQGAAPGPFGGAHFHDELAALSWNLLMGLVGVYPPTGAAHPPRCAGVARLRVKLWIDPECQVMTGRIRGAKPWLRRDFVARAAAGPVCDAARACPEGELCELPPGLCQAADLAGVCVPTDVGCTTLWDPVCGCDGRTYGNDCERRRAGLTKDHDGAC